MKFGVFSCYLSFSAIECRHCASNVSNVSKVLKSVKMVTIFCHEMLSGWLAKICTFLVFLIRFVAPREIPCFGDFLIFTKTDKMTKSGSFSCLF